MEQGMKILIVEDDADSAQSVAELCHLWGFQTVSVNDGKTALEAAKVFQPQVVLLDIGIPTLDGFKVARALRADPDFTSILIIGISGYGDQVFRELAASVGFDLYLNKPADPQLLKGTLDRFARISHRLKPKDKV